MLEAPDILDFNAGDIQDRTLYFDVPKLRKFVGFSLGGSGFRSFRLCHSDRAGLSVCNPPSC